jgi:hypothetical protein
MHQQTKIPVQSQTEPPRYRPWLVILAGVVVLAGASAFVGWRGLQRVNGPPATGSPARPTVTVPAPPPATRQAPPATPPGVLWQQSGSDQHRGSLFEATGRWRLAWSYDCSGPGSGGVGNFRLSGEGAFHQILIQRFELRARGSQSVSATGRGRLVVDSICERWTVRALAG